MKSGINNERLFWKKMESPIGNIFIGWTKKGLLFVNFIQARALKQILFDLIREEFKPFTVTEGREVDQLAEYFTGTRKEFSCKLDMRGSPFQIKVWNELLKIPYGTTRSYGEVAKAIGTPKASRAIGSANHANRISIFIPCHRVIGSNGRLVGYGGGLDRKRWLLNHEAKNI